MTLILMYYYYKIFYVINYLYNIIYITFKVIIIKINYL